MVLVVLVVKKLAPTAPPKALPRIPLGKYANRRPKLNAMLETTHPTTRAPVQAYGWNQFLLGSVADYCLKNSQYPVMIVRDYKYEPPLVIPMRSANPTPRQTTDH